MSTSKQRKSNRKKTPTMSDMYSLDNHEHLLMMMSNTSTEDEAEEEDVQCKANIDADIDWSRDQRDNLRNTTASGFETASSKSESSDSESKLLNINSQMALNKSSPIKQSLTRKLLTFEYDDKAWGDYADTDSLLLLEPQSSDQDFVSTNRVIPQSNSTMKWMSKRDHDPEYEAIRKMVIRSEENVNHIITSKIRKQSDNEIQNRMLKLDRSVFLATKKYQNVRAKTLELTSNMKENLELVAENEGEHWDFFKEITQKWITCLSGSSNFINEFEEESNDKQIQDDVDYCQRRVLSHKLSASTPSKRRIKAPRLNVRSSFVSRNIKATQKSKPRDCMRLPKLTDEEAQQVDDILNKCKTEDTNNHFIEDTPDSYNYYQLSGNERHRLADLNAALGLPGPMVSEKPEHCPRVTFADDLPSKRSPQKMMPRSDRKRINDIERELDNIALELPQSIPSLTTALLENAEELNADDYSEFRAKRIVNYAFNVTDNEPST